MSVNLKSKAWRMCNLYAIKDGSGRVVKFRPNAAQRHYYNHQHLRNHILKARKLGFSTFSMIDACDEMIFNPGQVIGVIDFSLPDAKKKLRMIHTAWVNMDNAAIHGNDQALLGGMLKNMCAMNPTETMIKCSNGSEAYCSTSLRGDTPTRLYISELGKTAIKAPIKADEIRDGALNSVLPGSFLTIESTHEGGKMGMHYELLEAAMANDRDSLGVTDYKFHFYPWWLDERYQLKEKQELRKETLDYFEQLEVHRPDFCARHGFEFKPISDAAKLWWEKQHKTIRFSIFKEFPSMPGEAFNAPNNASIYGEWLLTLRAEGRLRAFAPNLSRPLYTFWDIGVSDSTALWLVQLDGRDILWLDWYEGEGKPGGHYAEKVREWEQKHGARIATHFLPHDAEHRGSFSAASYRAELERAGVGNTVIVPRTPEKWIGINKLRDLLPRCYFHERTAEKRVTDGVTHPSGFECLEMYSRAVTKSGSSFSNKPKHDQYSHTSDAARTFAEAMLHGLVSGEISHAPAKINSPLRPLHRRY